MCWPSVGKSYLIRLGWCWGFISAFAAQVFWALSQFAVLMFEGILFDVSEVSKICCCWIMGGWLGLLQKVRRDLPPLGFSEGGSNLTHWLFDFCWSWSSHSGFFGLPENFVGSLLTSLMLPLEMIRRSCHLSWWIFSLSGAASPRDFSEVALCCIFFKRFFGFDHFQSNGEFRGPFLRRDEACHWWILFDVIVISLT